MCAWPPAHVDFLSDSMDLLSPETLQPQSLLQRQGMPATQLQFQSDARPATTFEPPFPAAASLPGGLLPSLGFPEPMDLSPPFPGFMPPLPQPLNLYSHFFGSSIGAGLENSQPPPPSVSQGPYRDPLPLSPLQLHVEGFGFPTSSGLAARRATQLSAPGPNLAGLAPGNGSGTAVASNHFLQTTTFNFAATPSSTTTPHHPSTRHHQYTTPLHHPPTGLTATSGAVVHRDGSSWLDCQPPSPLIPNSDDLIDDLATNQFPPPATASFSRLVANQTHLVRFAASSRQRQLPQTPRSLVPAPRDPNHEVDLDSDSPNPPQESSSNHPFDRAQHLVEERDEADAFEHETGEGQEDGSKITVVSLLDDDITMPAAGSKKRTRAADDAGPSENKRRRSRSSTAASTRPARATKARKTVRPGSPVVIPDSDDVFLVDKDEEEEKLFDLTKDNKIPEELMEAPKEDSSIKLVKFECVICMDSVTDLTVTHCGHMFCAQCLHQAIVTDNTRKICPMCRQKLDLRPKTGLPNNKAKTYFHLELKLMPSKKQGKQPVRARGS